MSCVREGSLEPPYRPPHPDNSRNGEGRTGRFLRGLRRMFKRRSSGARADASPDHKSSSTSELLLERHQRRPEGAYGSGLSVSHDSVFTGERSGDESDDRPSPGHGTHFATSHRAELVAAVRRRGRGDGSDDDEDLGLPRSPPASPPTDKADKRHHAGISHSSCSDGSLLSVGSSEMDEDSSSGHHDHSRSDQSDCYNSSEPPTGVAPLSHSAAKHKMAVRPRRTHGAPRRKKNTQIAASALPITPELNEEMIRSTTPDVAHKTSEVVTESFSSSTTTTNTHYVTINEHRQQINRELQRVIETPQDTKLKSSSLPPGLALSQLVGQAPVKLSVAEQNTPRSSIKRSKSSSQGKSLRDISPKPQTQVSTSESQIYHEERSRYRSVEESCLLEKKTKSEKKSENEVIRAKKEESFFSRLLLRKSGKKSKKDQTDSDDRKKSEKVTQQYKVVDVDRGYESSGQKPVPAERRDKSAGQRVFANQMHKRIDNKGAYVHEDVYKDVYSAAKVSGVEYNITDLKIAEETDRMLNREMRNRISRRDEFIDKVEKCKRTSREAKEEHRESFNLHGHDRKKPPSSVQRLVEPFSTKAFIDNEILNTQETSPKVISDAIPVRSHRMRNLQNDYVFHSGSMPKNIPYFNPNIVISSSASPPKGVLHNSEHVKHFNRSSEHVTEYGRERQMTESKRESHRIKHVASSEDTYHTGLRSLGEEFVESRSSIGKSHSFRYASETASISSQETQMPSLPAIVGISEPFLESWEVNYRRNVNQHSESFRNDYSKRVSARNYNILQADSEANYDSLPSTDSSYLDSLKTDTQTEDKQLFGNTIHIDSKKRNSDISQIEAKIDDIISSPKPILAPILKSSSLDSVKSSPEKHVDDRRKTISIESSIIPGAKISDSIRKISKTEPENFVSVTHINREETPVLTKTEAPKLNKSDEKLQKTSKTGVPEFLKIQLNKVDAKPTINVVLTANVTPKKETPQYERDYDVDVEIIEAKAVPKETINNVVENTNQDVEAMTVSKKIPQPITPQSPSTPKTFFKRKSISVELHDKPEKSRTNSASTEGSTEKIFDNISMDQKSHSSFGSKSSIQSTDSNEPRIPDRHDETVIYRKKAVSLVKERSGKRNDDEPELMKVFARRSLKLKDSEAESIAQEIAEMKKDEEIANKSKMLKNEFNASIKSRDSDKENEEASKETDDKKIVNIAARVSQFGVAHYQRSVSISSVPSKRDSAPVYKSEANKYRKEVSDSTPEKRLRNRTFPDPSNERDDIKNLAKKADTLRKPWQKSEGSQEAVIDRDSDKDAVEEEKEKENEADDSPQFKGILQMRAEWERRAKQGMTK